MLSCVNSDIPVSLRCFVDCQLTHSNTFAGSLDAKLRKHKNLPLHEVHAIAKQLMDALMHMHCRGLLHRDVKPLNILWFKDGRVKLCDLGFAGCAPSAQDAKDQAMGTPSYMAPELWLQKPYNCTVTLILSLMFSSA